MCVYLLFLLFFLIPHVIQYILNFVVIDFVLFLYLINIRGPRGCDRIVVEFTTINVVCSNSAHSEVISIQHFMIKFVTGLWQVGAFSLGTPVSTITI